MMMVSGVGTKHYFHQNHLYSVAAMTNSTGAVVERYRYDAYGKRTVTNAAGTPIAASTVGQQRGFTGYHEDGETGLHYARERMYSTGLGRFVQRDPGTNFVNRPAPRDGYDDGMGLYSGHFIPNYLDPWGLRKCEHVLFAGHFYELLKKLGRGTSYDVDNTKPDDYDPKDPYDPKNNPGHEGGYTDDQGRRTHDKFGNTINYDGKDSRKNCGDRLGYVGCNRDWGNAMIDSATGGNGGVSGVPRPPGGLGVGNLDKATPEEKKKMGPGPQNKAALEAAWNAMLAQAKADCDSKKTCCDTITVRVECDADMTARAKDAGYPGFCTEKRVFQPCR